MSAYPATNGKGANIRELKLAMSLKSTSKGNKWHLETIYPRQFIAYSRNRWFLHYSNARYI